MSSKRLSYRLVSSVALCLLIVAVGCGGAGRAEALREQVRSLIPESAVVLLEEDGDCVEFAASPSCISTYLTIKGANFATRKRLLRQQGRSAGWRYLGESRGSQQLYFERGDYAGYVFVTEDEVIRRCPRIRDCRDHVYLVRD
jgi:hypothetical protein